MIVDAYEGFADRYDLFNQGSTGFDPVVVAFYRQLCAQHEVHRVLDCACGTGRDLLLFHSLGCQVVGSDLSPSMLKQARQKLDRRDVRVSLHRADYRVLEQIADRLFDAVACLSSSILHMPDEENVVRAFKSMRSVLREGGILVLTQGTSDKQWRAQPRFLPAVNTPDFTRLFVIDYLERGARYNILDIYHSEERNELQAWSVEYPQMLLRDDYERLLKTAGFQSIDFYGSYQMELYDKKTSDRLIVVAQT